MVTLARPKQNRTGSTTVDIQLHCTMLVIQFYTKKTVDVKIATARSWRYVGLALELSRILEERESATKWCKRKVNNSQIKPYLSRKRQLSECDSEARDAKGDAPVKRRRRPESSATTNSGMDDNNLEDGNLELTGFVKHAELMDYKYKCVEWQQGKCNKLNLKIKLKNGNVHFQQSRAVTIDYNPIKPKRMRGNEKCFLRTVSHIITCDQEEQVSVFLLGITCDRIHKYSLVS